ncbi:MAG TPA: Kdo hydroxylase family protein [Nitrococcus sp.]|nr:Kdo hydroxylase family protein [Nitrococcus sp.]
MVEILELHTPPADPETRSRALAALESGGIVYLPQHPFHLTDREQVFLDPAVVNQPRRHTGRARIIVETDIGKTRRCALDDKADQTAMEAMVGRFEQWSRAFLSDLVPRYTDKLEIGPTTFRPCPRTAAQGLHVDAFFPLPTQGRRVLRLFTNVNPSGLPRVWRVAEEHFEEFSARLKSRIKREIPGSGWLLERLHATKGRRTPYDHVMRQLRKLAKRDADYQRNAPQRLVEFPSGATWFTFTDGVLHGAVSGQFAFEQTFFLPVAGMREPDRSPLRTLERLFHRKLA